MDIPNNLKVTPFCEWLSTGKSEYDRYWRIYLRELTGEWSGPVGTPHKTRTLAIAAASDMDMEGYLHSGTHKYLPIAQPPAMPKVFIYRSPYRPMPLSYLPEDVEKSWSYDHSDIGQWTPATRYAFTKKIPNGIARQWDLEIVS